MLDIPYTLPPAIEIAQKSTETPLLIAEVGEASYDAQKQVATIRIHKAFEMRSKIKKYKGPYITLIYDGHIVNIEGCPVVKTPLPNIERDFPNVFRDTVDLHIGGVSQKLADKIEDLKCLQIDTATVKHVVD